MIFIEKTIPYEFFISEENFSKLKKLIESSYSVWDHKYTQEYPSCIVSILPKLESNPKEVIFKLGRKSIHKKYRIKDMKLYFEDTFSIKDILAAATDLSRWPFLEYPDLSKEGLKKALLEIENLTYSQKRNFFNKIILGRKPSYGLLFLDAHKVLQEFLPELTSGRNLTQNRFHAYDIYEHSLKALDGAMKADLIVRWAALLHDIGKVPTRKEKENGEASFHNHEILSAKMVVPIMKRLGISKEIGMQIKFLVRNHMFHYTKEWTDKTVRRFLRKIDLKDLQSLIDLRLADRKGSGKKKSFPKGLEMLVNHIQDVQQKDNIFKVTDLGIDGHQLMELGIEPGPGMGQILKILLEEVSSKKLSNETEILKKRVKELLSNSELSASKI